MSKQHQEPEKWTATSAQVRWVNERANELLRMYPRGGWREAHTSALLQWQKEHK